MFEVRQEAEEFSAFVSGEELEILDVTDDYVLAECTLEDLVAEQAQPILPISKSRSEVKMVLAPSSFMKYCYLPQQSIDARVHRLEHTLTGFGDLKFDNCARYSSAFKTLSELSHDQFRIL